MFSRKQKRSQGAEHPLPQIPAVPSLKRPHTSLADPSYRSGQQVANNIRENKFNPISHWSQKESWPEEYFEQTSQAREGFEQENNMNRILARKRSTSFPCGEQSDFSDVTPIDQKPREEKSAPYTHLGYETLLATKGSYMNKSDLGITDISKGLCRTPLTTEQQVPQQSIFRDGLFEEACQSVHARNEARVVLSTTGSNPCS